MGLEDLRRKYEKMASKINASSADLGRKTIYRFDKYCRHCGAGLLKIGVGPHYRKLPLLLWDKSYCSWECEEKGPNRNKRFIVIKESKNRNKENLIEDLAFVSLEILKEEALLSPVLKSIKHAEENYNSLMGKMHYMEFKTGAKWGKSKYYYWLNKLLHSSFASPPIQAEEEHAQSSF